MSQIRTHTQKFIIKACKQYKISVKTDFEETLRKLDLYYPSSDRDALNTKKVILTFQNYIPGNSRKKKEYCEIVCVNCNKRFDEDNNTVSAIIPEINNTDATSLYISKENSFSIEKNERSIFGKKPNYSSDYSRTFEFTGNQNLEGHKHCGCKNYESFLINKFTQINNNIDRLIEVLENFSRRQSNKNVNQIY